MFNSVNQSSKAIISQVKNGKIAHISLETETAHYHKLILMLDNQLTLVEECRSNETNEHLKKPLVKSISKEQAISICENHRAETLIEFVDEDVQDDYIDSIIELKEGIYEY